MYGGCSAIGTTVSFSSTGNNWKVKLSNKLMCCFLRENKSANEPYKVSDMAKPNSALPFQFYSLNAWENKWKWENYWSNITSFCLIEGGEILRIWGAYFWNTYRTWLLHKKDVVIQTLKRMLCVFLCIFSVLWWADFVTNELSGKSDYHNQNISFQICFLQNRAQELKIPINTHSNNGCYT